MAAACKTCLIFLSFIFGVAAYPSGAPDYTCYTQYPMHSRTPSKPLDSNPFTMTFTPSSYTPGQEVKITVEDSSGNTLIRGIQTSVRRATGNTEEIVGSFMGFSIDELKAFNCFNGTQNMLTQRHGHKKQKYTFSWMPPSTNVGNVIFRSTFLKSYRTFWWDVRKELPVSNDTVLPVQDSDYPVIPLNPWTTDVDLESCGESKGCFLLPRECEGSGCQFAATFRPAGNSSYTFELYANSDVDYISLGFSQDSEMGDDWTVSCTGRDGTLSVQEGWNPDEHNDRHLDIYTSAREIVYKDGILQCRFNLPVAFDIYSIDQGSDISFRSWDLSQKYRLMIAWGQTMPGSSVILYHHHLPAVSSDSVDLKENKIYRAATLDIMIKAHAAVMIVAWVLLTGMVTVISRHYKDWLPNTTLFGTKIWFQIHRELAMLVAVLTGIGLVLIFSHFGAYIRTYAKPHAFVGLAVTGCVGLQIIAGILRPKGESRLRPVFNWAHFFLGHASHILAAATMYLAFDISYISTDMKKYGVVALSLWVAVQVLWHVIFECLSRKQGIRKQFDHIALNEETTETSTDDDTMVIQHRLDSSCAYSMVFIVYTICLATLSVAVILSFLMS